jgi:predicted Zn-dependent protease
MKKQLLIFILISFLIESLMAQSLDKKAKDSILYLLFRPELSYQLHTPFTFEMYSPKKVLAIDSLNNMTEEQLLKGLKNAPNDCWIYEKLYYKSALKIADSVKKRNYAQKAHQTFEQYLMKHSFDTLAIERYATFSIFNKDYARAVEVLKFGTQQLIFYEPIYSSLSDLLLYNLNDFEQGKKYLDKAYYVNPSSLRVAFSRFMYNYWNELLAKGKIQEVDKILSPLNELLTKHPDSLAVQHLSHYCNTYLLLNIKSFQFADVEVNNPKEYGIELQKSKLTPQQEKDLDAAITFLQNRLKVGFPDEVYVKAHLGFHYFVKGDFVKALSYIDEVCKKQTDNPNAFEAAILLSHMTESQEMSIQRVEEKIKHAPATKDYLYLIEAKKLKNSSEKLELCQKAKELDPYSFQAYQYETIIFLAENELSKANKSLLSAKYFAPNDTYNQLLEASILLFENKIDEGKKILEELSKNNSSKTAKKILDLLN